MLKKKLSVDNHNNINDVTDLLFTMTINRSNIKLENHHDITNDENSSLNSEIKRAEYLTVLRESLKTNGQLNCNDTMILVDVLSQSLSDDKVSSRKLALDLLCEAMPLYGNNLDTDVGLLFPQLLQNLLHNQTVITQCTLRVLNLYYQYCSNKDVALNFLIHHGIHSEIKALRNEVLISIPALIKVVFNASQSQRLFYSILDCSDKMDDDEPCLPAVLCLEHIKDGMGEGQFQRFYATLNRDILAKYAKIMEHPSYGNTTTNCGHEHQEDVLFGFLPVRIIKNLRPEQSWQTRSDAIKEFLNIVTKTNENQRQMLNCRDLFEYIHNLVDDVNFNVALTSLHVLHQVIVKLGQETKVHLDVIMRILLKKLSDSKVVIRKINLRIGLSLMHTLSPSIFLQAILPLLKHKSTRVREEVINMITASLLSFPSSEFDLQSLPQLLGFTLLDKSKKVRLASLEFFAILAQQLGPRKLSPLVSAIDVLERKNKNADGLLRAVQARLNRRMLPKMNDDELVQYALKLPANSSSNMSADVAWILSASTGRSDTARSGTDQEPNELTERRLFSAGRNKLPWQNEPSNNTERKKIGSASIRPSISSMEEGLSSEVGPVNDAWVAKKTYTSNGNCNANDKAKADEKNYFYLYKNKMRRMKEAGLKADNILKSQLKNEKTYEQHGNSRTNLDEDASNRSSPRGPEKLGGVVSPRCSEQTSPVPMKPTLARSASKKLLDKMFDQRNNFSSDQEINDSSLAHTLPKMKGGLLHRLSSNDINEIYNSPFPSKPSMHRSPSGNLSFRQPAKPVVEETTNLIQMKKFSNSSPAVFNESFGQKFPLAPVQPYGRLDAMPQSFGVIDSNRTRSQSISPIEKRLNYKQVNGHHKVDQFIESREDLNVSPKLAKSAQEKLRRFEELKHRNSSNDQTFDGAVPYNDNSIHGRNSDSFGYHNSSLKEIGQIGNQYSKENQQNQDQNSRDYVDFDVTHDKPQNVDFMLNGGDSVDRVNVKMSKTIPLDLEITNHSPNFSPRTNNRKQANEFYYDRSLKEKENDLSRKVVHSPPIEKENYYNDHSPKEKEIGLSRKVVHSPPTENLIRDKSPNTVDHNNNNNSKGKKSPDDLNEKVKKSPRSLPPKAASSPKMKRKLSTRKPHQWNDETNEHPTAPPKACSSNDIESPLNNPLATMDTAFEMMKGNAEEWEAKLEALLLMRRLLRHHAEDISEFHPIVMAVLAEVKNLRSQVTRSALCCMGDIFTHAPRQVEQELEIILKTVLPKAGDTNQFIRADTEAAINRLVENVNPQKATTAIIATGVESRNGCVRNLCSKALADLAEAIGPVKFCQTKMNVAVAGKLAVDSQPESRYHGRRMLFLILNQPDLDYLLEKFLQPANLKHVRDVMETLRNKGLEPPSGSATVRRSTRNGSSVTASPASTRRSRRSDGTATERSAHSSKSKGSANGGKKPAVNAMDKEGLEFLEMLNSNTWTDRYEALDNLYDVVSRNPALVGFHISKVFDKLVPRLNDSNSKVNLYALQTLNRCIPVLGNSLSMVTSLLVESLKPALCSKNDAIYNAGRQCLSSLAKHVDTLTLIKPIINSAQLGNMRNKPDYIIILADLIQPVYGKKPGAITRQVLPFLWDLLSTSVSGVTSPGRPNLQQAICQLCSALYECMGEDLLQEADSKQARVSQRLAAVLNMKC